MREYTQIKADTRLSKEAMLMLIGLFKMKYSIISASEYALANSLRDRSLVQFFVITVSPLPLTAWMLTDAGKALVRDHLSGEMAATYI